MMKARIAAVLLLCAARPSGAQRAPDFVAFDTYVAQSVRDWNGVGLGISVVKGDSLVFAKGYGAIEVGKPARVDEHTRFAIGSTTKAMTSAALAMLADEGKLKWDDKVIDYIPELRLYDAYATRELTIRDLLTHRTGLPGTDLFWANDENTIPFSEVIKRLRYIRPTTSFRSTWNYQNVMYSIGGTLIERVSGMPWDAFIRTRIFVPLGMNESEALVSQIVGKPNVAVPHGEIRDTVRVVPIRSTDLVASAGSVYSSVSDMSKWMRFVLDSGRVGTKRLISPANFEELVAPQMRAPMDQYPALELSKPHFFSYALGWFVQDYRGSTVWMHTGSINGMSAIIGLMPEERVGVFVLGNLDHIELRHALMYKAFDLYGAGPSRDWSKDLKTLLASKGGGRPATAAAPHVATAKPTLALEKYAGTYVDSAYGNVVISAANGALSAKWDRLDIGVLDPWDYDAFRSRPKTPLANPVALSFQLDGAGGVASVRLSGNTFMRTRSTTGQ
jgi:CubicO group peptidase (beta-lactamase class C family)